MRKVATRRKKVRLLNVSDKQDHFQFVSVWLWSSKCFINPYIFKYKHETWYSLILILVSKFAGRKGRHFNGGPRTAQPHCATVRKASQSLQWKRKIQCGNSCGRMLTLFEIVAAVYFCIWCGNVVPTSLFSALHSCLLYSNIFLFHSVENRDISSWTTAVLQPAVTFLMPDVMS